MPKDLSVELDRLLTLKSRGFISETEYNRQKDLLLKGDTSEIVFIKPVAVVPPGTVSIKQLFLISAAIVLGIVALMLILRSNEPEKPVSKGEVVQPPAKFTESLPVIRENSILVDEAGLKKQIRHELKISGIICLDVGIASSGCLWVYVLDNGLNRDGLATTLCYTAKPYGVNCVTIMNNKGDAIGRSQCR